jgi:hypothetical protein
VTLTPELVQTLLTFIVGGGLVTLITQLVRGWRSLKTGARASTREVVKDLAAARDEAEDREAEVRLDKDYWRAVAGDYGYQLRARGITPNPPEPRSPSEQRRETTGSRRWLRAQRAPSTDEIEAIIDEDPPAPR